MTITDVRIRLITNNKESKGKMRAVASMTFDDEFVIHDIKVIEGAKGLFVTMPSRKDGNDNYVDVAHPLKTEVREKISAATLKAYYEALASEQTEE